ncbi:hypothetical protein C0992_001907 [Termitomyces sp. T32_za158]|nr:hypothetical protein C0992_001907 [Termitomyces sp. T32_za158]
MAATPGKVRSGIPGPARTSGIPTPSRSRASSTVLSPNPNPSDVEYMSRAFAEAIKANDPAHHRPSLASTASVSPKSTSGRRSVAARPSSVASTSSSAGNLHPRAKTPVQTHSRPPSRVSDVPKAAPRSFEVGDNVRIESLGFEGTLRYVGPIEGKQGTWAGVQLSGGFAGKGKNNGTVSGVRYFSCPERCGVFVSVIKLSAPTVGVGAAPRPSSVASRGGRITPALSGRITPSASSSTAGPRMSLSSSNGRVTPSNTGRITPSMSTGCVTPGTTPAARGRRPLAKSTSVKPEVPVPTEKFTPGSRASKYMSVTAKQLSSRKTAAGSPSRRFSEMESPTRSMSAPSHDLRSTTSIGSPFATPKPGLNGRTGSGNLPTPSKIRPSGSLNTPRARIPSAVAMPPPTSSISSRSVSYNERSVDAIDTSDLDAFSKGLQDRSSQLQSANVTSTRSDSAISFRSLAADDHALIDQLQSRINALEQDNERLHAVQSSSDSKADREVQDSLDDALSKIVNLEASLATSMTEKESQESRIKTLEDDRLRLQAALDAQNLAKENDVATLRGQLNTELAATEELRTKISEHEATTREKEAAILAKDGMITSLESRIAAVTTELQDEKIELGAQIDELRSAGQKQETIALYEERLSAADSQRYDLEHRISTLETRLQNAQKATSPPPPSLTGASAAEIDNETLREQIVHLQRKISTMEDALEDAQASAEREESIMGERMKRLKEKEDAMRKELNDGRKETEQILKSEAKAKSRVEEIEEALRESTVALENARAEVENLRSEMANLDGLVANHSGGDLFSRVAEAAQRAANDKAQYAKEIAQLQETIEQYRVNEGTSVKDDDAMRNVKRENTSLHEMIEDQQTKMSALLQSLDDTTKELETLRKKQNRDVTMNNGLQAPSKHDASAVKEEITGLKHIVQELQKENVASVQRIKILESENELLATEANQLRQEVQILEENLDKSLDQEEGDAGGINGDSPRKLREQKGRLETEQEQLRKRLVEVEMKSTRTIHDLNKEISELEALVESKIYREDELEQEVERLRQQVARQDKKLTKGSAEVGKEEGVCEICERPGHDIFGCDVLNKGAEADHELFCEDCESHGHIASDCPHSLDVF